MSRQVYLVTGADLDAWLLSFNKGNPRNQIGLAMLPLQKNRVLTTDGSEQYALTMVSSGAVEIPVITQNNQSRLMYVSQLEIPGNGRSVDPSTLHIRNLSQSQAQPVKIASNQAGGGATPAQPQSAALADLSERAAKYKQKKQSDIGTDKSEALSLVIHITKDAGNHGANSISDQDYLALAAAKNNPEVSKRRGLFASTVGGFVNEACDLFKTQITDAQARAAATPSKAPHHH